MKLIQLLSVLVIIGLAGPVQAVSAPPLYVLALGDSLTAGYGLEPDSAFPVRLQAALQADGLNVTVINAGVSGDTSSGGLTRLDWALQDVPDGKPDLVIVELGANDALRGIDPKLTKKNLAAIIEQLKGRGIAVLLAGMKAPPNMGGDYAREFDAIYPALARKYDIALYPFFLDGVAAKPALNQSDGMHPDRKGVDVIVTRIAPVVKKLLVATTKD